MSAWGEVEIATTLRPPRRRVADMHDDLRERWDNMEHMSPEEVAAHRKLFGAGAQADPDRMSTRQRADYFSDLNEKQGYGDPLTPREQLHYDGMEDWAEHHFADRHMHAHQQIQKWKALDQQPEGDPRAHPTPHDPELTVNWAHQEIRGTNSHVRQRALEYRDALKNMGTEGPMGVNPKTQRFHHQDYEDAQNNLRIELQQHGRFKVPSTDELSRIENPDEHHGNGGVINPRFTTGLGVTPAWAKDVPGASVARDRSHQVNCQRSVLAEEARHKGYNVEAQRNFKLNDANGFPHDKNDRRITDHVLASWFPRADGSTPAWGDAQDMFDDVEHGPQQWDAMTDHIGKHWGPGARGIVAMSYHTSVRDPETGNLINPELHKRHVISVKVGDDGAVKYNDPQSAQDDVGEKWRTKVGYDLHGHNVDKRNGAWQELSGGTISPSTHALKVNASASPLRFLRTDNKELHPDTAQYMVDRGTAPSKPIAPPVLPRGK